MRVLIIVTRACVSVRLNACFVIACALIQLVPLFALSSHHPLLNLPSRSQKLTDKLLPTTTVDELVAHIGMTLGEAKELKLAVSSATLLPSAGGGAAVAVATGGVGSMSLSSSQPFVASAVRPLSICLITTRACSRLFLHLQLPSAGGERCLATSNFKRLYEATEAPQFQDQVISATPCLFAPHCSHLTRTTSFSNHSGCCWLRTARHEERLKQARWPSSRICSGRRSST